MAFAKRIVLFLLVNFLVVAVISFILHLFNVQPYLQRQGLNYTSLAIFCLIWGMGGAFVSLLLSKTLAKWSMGVQIIDPNTRDPYLKSLIQTVHSQAQRAGLRSLPEVGIYESNEVNAFATGPSSAHSLVAVSSGLLRRMGKDEVEAIVGHEVTHIANGDMVTMTLLQGVINAFVMFLARIIAFFVSGGSKDREESNASPFAYSMIVFLLEMVFMVLGTIVVAWFSRYREFRADAGGARLAGTQKMIDALTALKRTVDIQDPRSEQPAYQAFKISSNRSIMRLFATHPPIEERIEALRKAG